MALKNKTHDLERVSTVQRAPQRGARTSSEHERSSHHAVDLQRAITSQSSALRPKDVLALQRTVGNRAVQQILAQHDRRSTIQTKLAVGPADDHYEREADHVAASVMQTSEPVAPQIQRQSLEEEDRETIQTKPLASSITPLIQRQELSEGEEKEEENPIQTKSLVSSIQRQETPDEEDENENLVQRRSDGGPTNVMPGVEHVIERVRGRGQSLPDGLRTQMERSFGADFSAVRVHADSESDSLNRSLHARAFTTGHDLFFRRGEYNPDNRRGQELIAHELTHVVQQNGGVSGKKDLSVRRSTSSVIQRDPLDEERGFYNVDATGPYGNYANEEGRSTRRENYNRDEKMDLLNYSLIVASAGFAGGKALADRVQVVSDATGAWEKTKAFFVESTPVLSDAGKTLSVLGAVSAGAGTATAVMDTYKGVKEWRDKANTKAQQNMGLGSGLSGLGNVGQQSATTAYHLGNATGSAAVAATAQIATGGAALLTGAADIMRGFYAISKAKQNIKRLQHPYNAERNEAIAKAAKQAQTTQEMRKSTAKFTVAKGVLTAIGGGMLLASAATPVGWLLIGAGAVLGGYAALRKLYDKSKRKEAVARMVLGVSDAEMKDWEKKVEVIKAETGYFSDERKTRLAKLGGSPLEKKLKADNFISVGHFYANYIHKTANEIYNLGIARRQDLDAKVGTLIAKKKLPEPEKQQTLARLKRMSIRQIWLWSKSKLPGILGHVYGEIEDLLKGMGLKADFGKTPPEPQPEKIGKALHD